MSMQGMTSTLFYNNVLSAEEGANAQAMLAADMEVAKGHFLFFPASPFRLALSG
jgi:hypothetical protein